jgi:single-strand DNA-binding protein
MNKTILLGNLGRDPELRYTASGVAVCDFSIATTERRKQGDQWGEHTEWHNITAWGKQAENCANFIRKGSKVLIEGKNQTESYEHKDHPGLMIYRTKVIAQSVQFIGKREYSQPVNRDTVAPQTVQSVAYSEDDIPF